MRASGVDAPATTTIRPIAELHPLTRREWERLVVVYLIVCALYAVYAVQRHANFQTTAFDLGIFDQALWKWSQFLSPENTVRRVPNLFGDHFHPAILLLVPIRWLGFDIRGVLIAQPLIACAAVFPIFAFARRRLSATPSLCLAIAFLGSWGLAQGLGFDVHEVAFTTLALSLAVNAYDRGIGWKFWLYIGCWLLTKEDQGLAVASLGLVALVQRRWAIGGGLIVLGLTWLLIAVKVIIPHLAGGDYSHWLYESLGATPGAVAIGVFTRPGRFLAALVTPALKRQTILKLLGGYALLPLLSPYGLLLLLPTLSLILTDSNVSWSGGFHYWMSLSATSALAASDGLARLLATIERRKGLPAVQRWRFAMAAIVLLTTLGASAKIPQFGLAHGSFWARSEMREAGDRILQLVPKNAPVSATNAALAHLSSRSEAYLLRYGFPFGKGFPAVKARYVVVDPAAFDATGRRKDCHPFNDPEYELLREDHNWFVYRIRAGVAETRGFVLIAPFEGSQMEPKLITDLRAQ